MNIEIESSYRKNDIGKTIYETVLKYKPKIAIDFGVLYGYSTVCMAKALKEIGEGKIIVYDLWNKYPYRHAVKKDFIKNMKKYNLLDVIEIKQLDFFEWLKNPVYFDFMHLDISNDGYIIEYVYNKLRSFIEDGSVIIFEGGTIERDQEEWMIKYEKTPIYPLKDKLNYEIINSNWPGLSLIQRQEL